MSANKTVGIVEATASYEAWLARFAPLNKSDLDAKHAAMAEDARIGGSGTLIDYLTVHELVDEYRMMIYPIVLGEGTRRLFSDVPRRTFTLAESQALPNGVMINTYHPAARTEA